MSIFVETEKLDPNKAIKEKASFDLDPIIEGDGEDATSHPVKLDLIEWKAASERCFFLCGVHDFPFQRTAPRFHTPGYKFSAYLKSNYIDELQERGELDFSEMNQALLDAHDAAAELIKKHFENKEIEAA